MIEVRFEDNRMTVNGHAGLDEYGKDILCAAASILTYTLATRLLEIEERVDDFETKIDMQCVYACLEWSKTTIELAFLLHTVKTGFYLLQQQYPQNIGLEIVTAE